MLMSIPGLLRMHRLVREGVGPPESHESNQKVFEIQVKARLQV